MEKMYVGKRKKATARIKIVSGDKNVKINEKNLEELPKVVQLKILEPLKIIEDENFTIKAKVKGGGVMGQAEAVAQAISRGLADIKGEEVRNKIMDYDRNLLIQDIRRTEPHKPSRSKQGPRRHKQRSKR